MTVKKRKRRDCTLMFSTQLLWHRSNAPGYKNREMNDCSKLKIMSHLLVCTAIVVSLGLAV